MLAFARRRVQDKFSQWILTISKERLVEKIGTLELQYTNKVEEALKLVLGLGIDV
jgi:hypothetical protein